MFWSGRANMMEYEHVSFLLKSTPWPCLAGEIPLSGFLMQGEGKSLVEQMAVEASKLRWWKNNMSAIDALLQEIISTAQTIGKNPKKR